MKAQIYSTKWQAGDDHSPTEVGLNPDQEYRRFEAANVNTALIHQSRTGRFRAESVQTLNSCGGTSPCESYMSVWCEQDFSGVNWACVSLWKFGTALTGLEITGNHGKVSGQKLFCIWDERSSWEFWGGVGLESERLTGRSCQSNRMGRDWCMEEPMLLTIRLTITIWTFILIIVSLFLVINSQLWVNISHFWGFVFFQIAKT